MLLGEGWVSANIVHRNDIRKRSGVNRSNGFSHSDSRIWIWSPLILTGTLHDQMLNSRNTCRYKGPGRPQGWGHYMHYILLLSEVMHYINYCPYEVVVVVTWLTEVMAYDTSYQLSVLRCLPVHLTSGEPNWSHWVVGQALTSGFIQVF